MFKKSLKTALLFVAISLVLTSFSVPRRALAVEGVPDDLIIMKVYKRGMGEPVGSVTFASGKAFIMHSDKKYGYAARPGLSVYEGDTLFTGDDGKLVAQMKDNSRISLVSGSSIVINKSIYDPARKSRASFMSMLAGKIRFIVTKLSDYKYSRFNVKTKSSVVGVRGSDFIIESMDEEERVITLEDTELEILDPENPDQPPVIMTDFQQLDIVPGEPFGEPVDVPRDQIDGMISDFAGNGNGDQDQGVSGGQQDEGGGAAGEEPASDQNVDQEGGQSDVDSSQLEQPDSVGEVEDDTGGVVEDTLDTGTDTDTQDSITDVEDRVGTEVFQGEGGTLPDMPGEPSMYQ